jgi:hypothetical protein
VIKVAYEQSAGAYPLHARPQLRGEMTLADSIAGEPVHADHHALVGFASPLHLDAERTPRDTMVGENAHSSRAHSDNHAVVLALALSC